MVCKVLPVQDFSLDRVPELGPVEQGVEMAQEDVISSDHFPGLCYRSSLGKDYKLWVYNASECLPCRVCFTQIPPELCPVLELVVKSENKLNLETAVFINYEIARDLCFFVVTDLDPYNDWSDPQHKFSCLSFHIRETRLVHLHI